MVTEKEMIFNILKNRGIIKADGTIDKVRFQKLVTEPWIHQKAKLYGFLDGTAANEVVEVPVAPTTVEINENPVEQEVNLTELPAEEVTGEPLENEELNDQDVAEPSEEISEEVPVEALVEEAPAEDVKEEPVEELVEEVPAEVPAADPEPEPEQEPAKEVAAPKKAAKKSSKK